MYMFFWFFKQLYYCLRRIFKSGLLLLVVFFIAFLFIFIKPSFAFSQEDLSYSGMTSQQQTDIYNFIYSHRTKGDYWDSVFVRYYVSSGVGRYSFIFYNIDDLGRLYSQPNNSTPIYFNYFIYAENPTQYNNYYYVVTSSDFTEISSGYGSTFPIGLRTGGTDPNYNHPSNIISDNIFATNRNIYTNSNYNNLWFQATEYNIADVYITNTTESITSFSFNNLSINTGGLPFDDYYEVSFTYPDLNTIYTGSVEAYKVIANNRLYINIPRSWFTNDIVIRSGSQITFNLIHYHRQEPSVTEETFFLGSYTLNLTTEQEDEINEDSNKQLLSDINKTQQQTNNKLDNLNTFQQETTQAVENLENTITDTNIDNNSINLPTDNSTDITQEGLNGIFTSIYNAFCVGDPQDIVFPIPFTNKNITLKPNYVREMLTNSGANWVITIIETFWWYLISRFIIKDITNKITKIKSGNIENIENTNIKGDML